MRSTILRAIPAAVLLGLVVASGPLRAGQVDHPWPVSGGNPEHTGSAEGPAPAYAVSWEADLEDGATPIAGPVVGGDAVVVPARTEVLALDAATGAERWTVLRKAGPGGPPAVGEDRVVFAEGAGDEAATVAVALEGGEEIWRTPIDGAAPGGVTIAEEAAFVGTTAGTVFALGLEDGEVRWTAATGSREAEEGGPEEVESAPAVAGGAVLVSAEDRRQRTGAVYALESGSGERRWVFRPGGNVAGFSSPSVAGGDVIVGGGDIMVHALGLEDGLERWSSRVRAPFGSRHVLALPDGAVVVGDVLGHVYRLDPATGEERWVFRVPGLLTAGSVSVSDGTALVGDDGGQLSALDVERGVLVWKRTIGDLPVGGLAVDGDRIYVASRSGKALALEHDPDAGLLDEPSPTTLFPVRALLNYAAAFGIVLAAALLLSRLLRREG